LYGSGPTKTRFQWFNPCAFKTPDTGTLGNQGRNTLQAQGYWNFDTSVDRSFPIHDQLSVNLRVEAYNVFNHPVLNTPGATTTTTSSLGTISSTASTQRILQFSGKIVF
jgi:hypothetical protein